MADHPAIKAVLDKSLPVLQQSLDSKSVENGAYIGRASAQSAPQLTLSSPRASDPAKKYLLINIDLDAPFASFNFLSPILHMFQTDLTFSASDTLETGTSPLIPWAPPGPPPGAGPHRYVSVLYEQPESFKSEALFPTLPIKMTGRMRFDFAGFEKKAGVGKPIAGSWFTSN